MTPSEPHARWSRGRYRCSPFAGINAVCSSKYRSDDVFPLITERFRADRPGTYCLQNAHVYASRVSAAISASVVSRVAALDRRAQNAEIGAHPMR